LNMDTMTRQADKESIRIDLPREGAMRVPAFILTSRRLDLEPTAVQQLRDAASVPPVYKVLATPDIHQGYGVPIGCVLALDNAVMPAAVGYDINCGMRVIATDVPADRVDLRQLAHSISRDVPLGEGHDNIRLSWAGLEEVLAGGVASLPDVATRPDTPGHRAWNSLDPGEIERDRERIEAGGSLPGQPAAVSEHARKRARDQLATLGGGNHFIELQRVESIDDQASADAFGLFVGQLLVMIHSGSRGLGHQVGGDYMAIAETMTRSLAPNKMLCYLPADSPEGRRYIGAMNAAANFAFANRELIGVLVRREIRHQLGADTRVELIYDVTHNMAKLEEHDGHKLWVHRKGATRAFGPGRMAGTPFEKTGQPVIIPGSMGTASYLLVGVDGNDVTLCSVNHGAGRRMSRSAARGVRRGGRVVRPGAISDEEFAAAMRGIELIAGDRAAAIEEAPQAYKDIDEVIRVVVAAGLARVVARLKPLAVMKG